MALTAALAWVVLRRVGQEEPVAGERPPAEVRVETRRQLGDLAPVLASLDERVQLIAQADAESVAEEGCPAGLLEPSDDVHASRQVSELADSLLAEACALRETLVIRAGVACIERQPAEFMKAQALVIAADELVEARTRLLQG